MLGVLSETLYNLLQMVSEEHHVFLFFNNMSVCIHTSIFFCFPSPPAHVISFQEWEQRQEEDNLLIERILMLVRNVLHVPADPLEEKVNVLQFDWMNWMHRIPELESLYW